MSDFDMYRLFKTLHVLFVVLLGSGVVFEGVLGPLMAKASNVQELRVYTRILGVVERIIFPVSFLFVAGFGYATASKLKIDMSTTWLVLAQVFFYIAAVIGFGFLARAGKKLERTVAASPDGPITAELQAQLRNPLPPILGAVTSLLFITIVYLMVYKPQF